MKEEERIRCPVHDLISFKRSRDEDVLLWELIQTSPVQRLRRIKQLGFSEFVYPGANHSRLSHVLGAMQMARRMLDVFERNDAYEKVGDLPREKTATLAAALLLRTILDERREEDALKNLPLIRFFKNNGDLSDYAAFDDSTILSIAHIAADNRWGLASELAQRFFCRDTYKCFEVPGTTTGNVGRQRLKRFREALHNENIYYIEDILSHRSYKQHAVTDTDFLKNILIKIDGEIESLGNVSLLLKEPAPRVARVYFRNEADKARAQAIFRSL